jgi:putative membrane protein
MDNSSPDQFEKLAKARTDLAEDRTVLASERTFASWFRTGFGSVGIGLGFQALFLKMEPAWVPRSIATAFLLLGVYLFIAAERRACSVLDRLQAHEVKAFRNARLRLITIAASAAVAALVLALWLLPFRRV